MKHRVIPTQESWAAVLEFIGEEDNRLIGLLRKESTKLEEVPGIRAQLKLLSKLLNLPNQPGEIE